MPHHSPQSRSPQCDHRSTKGNDIDRTPQTLLQHQWPSREGLGCMIPGEGLKEHGERAGGPSGRPSPDPLPSPLGHSRTQRLPSSWSWNSGRHWQRCWVTVSWTQLCWQPPLPTAQELMAGDPRGVRSPQGGRPGRRAPPQAGSEHLLQEASGTSEPLRPSCPRPKSRGFERAAQLPSRSQAWLCFSAHTWDTQGHDPNLGPLVQPAPGLDVRRHCRAPQWKPSPCPATPGTEHKTPGPAEGQGIQGSGSSRLGASLEEQEASRGWGRPTHSTVGHQARAEGQAWASVDSQHDLQA